MKITFLVPAGCFLGLTMSQIETEKIADHFDHNRNGNIDLGEIMTVLKGSKSRARAQPTSQPMTDAEKIEHEVGHQRDRQIHIFSIYLVCYNSLVPFFNRSRCRYQNALAHRGSRSLVLQRASTRCVTLVQSCIPGIDWCSWQLYASCTIWKRSIQCMYDVFFLAGRCCCFGLVAQKFLFIFVCFFHVLWCIDPTIGIGPHCMGIVKLVSIGDALGDVL